MNITTIQIPIYDMEITVILDDWDKANKKFKLGLDSADLEAEGLTIQSEDNYFVHVLLKSKHKSVFLHELFHVMSCVSRHTGIIMDRDNDEAFAHMQEYIGREIATFIGYAKNT